VEWGALTVAASLRPRAAALVLPGGIPRSPIPTLIGLLTIAAALVAGASMLMWRMHELGRLRADFTSSVSHELRTPLTQILLYAETLEMGRHRSAEKRAEAIGVITRETRRLIHLVENVLHYSRAERSLTRLDVRAQELGRLVTDTVSAFAPVAATHGSTVSLRLSGPVYARVDGDAIRRVLLNLLDNAVRYGPPGQTVVVGLESDGPWARVMVEDEGPGVPSDMRDEIWRPFVRHDSTGSVSVMGCGIGLAIVSDLVALHGGRRGVRSRSGGGAVFFIEVPGAASVEVEPRALEVPPEAPIASMRSAGR
jgi:signal transduction histidine kinase